MTSPSVSHYHETSSFWLLPLWQARPALYKRGSYYPLHTWHPDDWCFRNVHPPASVNQGDLWHYSLQPDQAEACVGLFQGSAIIRLHYLLHPRMIQSGAVDSHGCH